MAQFIVRRLWQSVVVLWLITLLSYLLMYSSPGNFINPFAFPGQIGQTQMNLILHNLGLDRPWYVQYGHWLWNLLHLNLGRSFKTNQPVLSEIGERLPATLELTVTALLISLVFGVLIGVLSALRRGSLFDHLTRVLSVAGHAVPVFWLGLVAIWIVSVKLGWLPSSGIASPNASGLDIVDRLKHLVLPATILSFGLGADISRYIRGEMLEVLRQDYVRTARAKGLTARIILFRHTLRNALIPLVTLLGLHLGFLFGGTVLIEDIFAWPGMGRLIVDAAFERDYPVIMGGTLVVAVMVILGNLLADVLYVFVDPRIKLA